MDEFVKSNLKYPEDALTNKIEGTVMVDFDIDVYGEVIAAKVKHGIGYGCDEEAVRLVKLLKYSKRKYQGIRVVFHNSIGIHFRIHEASKPLPEKQTLTYTYTEKKDDNKLGYTIKL